MPRSTIMLAVALALLSTLLAPSAAHDLWLLPAESATPGQTTVIRVHQGMDFPLSESAPNTASWLERYVIRPDGTRHDLDFGGAVETTSFLKFEAPTEGVYIAAVQTNPKVLEMPAAEFNAYLVTDGLPHIYVLRHTEGTLNQPAKERYSKSPKMLLKVGTAAAGDPSRVLGLPLEIVPLRDPFTLKVGDTLLVRVLFKGNPLPAANLGWDTPGDGTVFSGTVLTNSKGEALVPISMTGLYTIRLTHMTRPKTADYEWESFWTTLTWRVPAPK